MIDDSVINTLILRDVCDHLGLTFDEVDNDHTTVGMVYGGTIPNVGSVTYTVILLDTNLLIMVRTIRSMFAVTHDTLLNQVSP